MTPKKKGKRARSRYMMADFMRDEKDEIIAYCLEEGTTISSFLAEVALEDLYRASREEPEEEELEIKLRIPVKDSAKLQRFARRKGQSINQFMSEILKPLLAKEQTSFRNPDIASLRYYVSPEEHRLLKKYFKANHLSPRTYVPYLALKALKQRRKKKNKKEEN